MQKAYYLLILLAIFNIMACQKKSKPENHITSFDFEKLVKKENDDFYKKNFDAWSSNFVHSSDVYWICVEDAVTLRAMGWDDLGKFVNDWMRENPKPEASNDIYSDFKTTVSEGLAFVTYKKTSKVDTINKIFLEHRTFKKVNDHWKVLGMTSAPGHNSKGSNANVFVHTSAN